MDDLKKDYRSVKNDAKEAWRKSDGEEDLGDKLANVGDDLRDEMGNAGDDIRREVNEHTDDHE